MDNQDQSRRRNKRVEELENENRRLHDGVVRSLVQSNDLMARELEQLKNRMRALEAGGDAGGAARSETAAAPTAINNNANEGRTKSIKWAEEKIDRTSTRALLNSGLNDDSDHVVTPNTNNNDPPPMRKIKFVDHIIENPQDVNNNNIEDDDDAASFDSSSSSSSSEVIAFSGWARVFFQARHHRASTQITSSATTTPSQDTYLHLSISSTSNVLRISDTDDTNNNNSSSSKNDKKPPLIDPPIPLKYFHAVKVPGSHSGAALFLKNDTRRLRKYIFRFEFVNRSVHQPPQRYIQFLRSGKAAKKSMRSINKMKRAFKGMGGEERKENMKEDKKKATDAFAAHLGTLDELLRESNELADRFVECVNERNEEEELMMSQAAAVGSGGANASSGAVGIKRSRPPPPYWGSGFNRPSTNDQDDDIESDSDFSDDDEELYYDDDNDDETLFDKVQVSTEQTLETLWNQIVK
ncbi:hypothetical protein QTG54_005585 [Skeletonema marinoi]|uniref:Uncharacterized protein n=1 Tax=Skeletonema marinoi TaxID=267567 RepID=A0AAD8YDW2_9STRA|nr:hypothetical protein QTG54_005585 [Skeletonema marinoi]